MDFFAPRIKRKATFCYLLIFSAAALLRAQQPAGEIRIEVKDPSGAVVQAKALLRNLDTGATRTFQTDKKGAYDFANLPYSRYQLQISRTGFATQSVQVDVESSTLISRMVTLEVANAASKIEVVAATPSPVRI